MKAEVMNWLFILIGFIIVIVLYVKFKEEIFKNYRNSIPVEEKFIGSASGSRPSSTTTATASASIPSPNPSTTTATASASASRPSPNPSTTTASASASIPSPNPPTTTTTPPASGSLAPSPSTQNYSTSVSYPLTAAVSIPSNKTIVQQSNIKLYINSFNIYDTDPRNIITIQYAFNTYYENSLTNFKATNIENVIAAQLNLPMGNVIVTDLYIDPPTGNSVATFNIKYTQLSQATAALTELDDKLQLNSTKNAIFGVLNGASALIKMSNPKQGTATNANYTYFCESNTWCDFYNSNFKFNIKGSNIPTSIGNNGLRLYGLTLSGPPSEKLSTFVNNYYLDSFTVSFYIKFNSLDFNSGNSIIWYQMFAETPNMVRIAIYKNNNDSSIVEAILGNKDTNYRWILPNTTLMSNGNTTLYSFVYDKTNSKLLFYIGSTISVANLESTTDKPIILALTPVSINRGVQSMDANIYAFVYYNTVLSAYDLQQLNEFFQYEKDGITRILQTNNNILTDYNKLSNETATIYGKLTQQAMASSKCPTNTVAVPVVDVSKSSKWQVNYNTNIDPTLIDKLNQCSPLKLKQYDISNKDINKNKPFTGNANGSPTIAPKKLVKIDESQLVTSPPTKENKTDSKPFNFLKSIFT
jgi:hypothetical protein